MSEIIDEYEISWAKNQLEQADYNIEVSPKVPVEELLSLWKAHSYWSGYVAALELKYDR